MTAVEELIEEFTHLDQREACQVLDELGRDLPKIAESVYVKQNLVPGCQSRVWMVNELTENDTIHIQADSDAIVVKGLIYVVLEMFEGLTPDAALHVDYVTTFERLGLGKLILPQRKNGLFAMVNRIRNFAASSLGVEMPPELAPGSKVVQEEIKPTRSIDGIAKEFPILCKPLPSGKLPIFLDSGASAQKPASVIAKQREVEEEYYANAFRGRYYFGQRIDDEIEAARTKTARLIGAARTDEIVFTSGTTMSINIVAAAWGRKFLKPGDEVVVTEMEHHANFVPWQAIAREQGAKFRVWPIQDDGLLDMGKMNEFITEKTAMVAVCSMSNVLGTMNPIKQIAARAHECGAKILVDAAQSVPHTKHDVAADDVDFLVFSGHKIYGPSAVGVLYGRHELLSEMDPLLYGGHMIQSVGVEQSTWAAPPAKFEAGTMPIVPIIGLGAAIDFVNSIGYRSIQEHEHRLSEFAHQRLAQIPGLTIYGPKNLSQKGAICSFTIDGVATEDLARRLDEAGIFTRHGHHCAMVLHDRLGIPATTRASFGIYNTTDDVEALATAIEESIKQLRR